MPGHVGCTVIHISPFPKELKNNTNKQSSYPIPSHLSTPAYCLLSSFTFKLQSKCPRHNLMPIPEGHLLKVQCLHLNVKRLVLRLGIIDDSWYRSVSGFVFDWMYILLKKLHHTRTHRFTHVHWESSQKFEYIVLWNAIYFLSPQNKMPFYLKNWKPLKQNPLLVLTSGYVGNWKSECVNFLSCPCTTKQAALTEKCMSSFKCTTAALYTQNYLQELNC